MQNVSSSNSQAVNVPKLRFPGFEGEWYVSSFNEIFDFLSNNTLSRAELTDEGKIKNIHYGDILTKFGDVVDCTKEELPYIADKAKLGSKTSYLQNGDVIIADTAEDDTVGKATEVFNIQTPVVSGLHTMACRPRLNFKSRFLGYYINSDCYHNQLYPFMQGVKVTSISKGNIALTKIRYPANKEQQKIASMIALLDDRIKKQQQLIDSLKLYKRGLIQTIFEKFITESNSDEIAIEELFENIIDKGYSNETVLTIIQGFGTIPRDAVERRISYNKKSVSTYKRVKKNDYIMHLRSFEGGLEIANEQGIVSPAYTILRAKKKISPNFYYSYFRSYTFINDKLRITVEGIRDGKSINMSSFWKIKIPFPSYKLQSMYGNIISSFDKKVAFEEDQLTNMNNIKRYLLSNLFV